jgi:hypothetical protein
MQAMGILPAVLSRACTTGDTAAPDGPTRGAAAARAPLSSRPCRRCCRDAGRRVPALPHLAMCKRHTQRQLLARV